MMFKKINITSLFMFATISLLSLSLESKMFLGNILFPVEVTPTICLFYQGQNLLLDTRKDQEYKNISFSIDESSRVQTMHILITLEPSCFAQDNNIIHLTTCTPAPYKLYQLQGTRYFNNKGEEVLSWNIIEKKLEENVVPGYTLLFVFDPELVEELQEVSWSKKDSMRILPKIIMKKNATVEQFSNAINIACLSAMDLYPYHKRAGVQAVQKKQIIAKLSNNMRITAG